MQSRGTSLHPRLSVRPEPTPAKPGTPVAGPTPEVKAQIAARVGERPIRYYGPDDAITMDFSPGRLNVELGKDGRIKLFRCG